MSDRPHVVVPCRDLDDTVAAYLGIGFRLAAIGPADEPTWAELDVDGPGGGLRVRLDASASPDGFCLRIPGLSSTDRLPDRVEPAPPASAEPPPVEQALAITHADRSGWVIGRAGMRYRDLIPDRHGGAFIASHIHIPDGGPVPDQVHHHDIGFQIIFCHRGWVRVVYQDQGPPFELGPGDLVLQPPGLRHQVLASSDDLFVVEVTCPADHRTLIDHGLTLPNQALEAGRRYGGQRFVHHRANGAAWEPAEHGWEEQRTGVAAATDGDGQVRLIRPDGPASAASPLV
ncbi:MAG: AraC family ligand binding domain-containing protein, partial [Actinomycetota bacterium]